MIRVDMDLISAISNSRNARLASITIANDGTGTTHKSNYDYVCYGRRSQVIKRGKIMGWARQAKTPLALLQAVLNDAYPKGAR